MRANWQSTAAQRSYIASLVAQKTKAGKEELVENLFIDAARVNGNKPKGSDETVTQFTRRLSKKVCSQLIDELLKI